MQRREFLQFLALAASAGASLLHITDTHAQLLPAYFREPNPIWNVVSRYLSANRNIRPLQAHRPRLIGVDADPGIA